MKAVVEEIYVAPKGSAAMERVEEVQTVEGRASRACGWIIPNPGE